MLSLTKKTMTRVNSKMPNVGQATSLARRRILAGNASLLVGTGGMAGLVSASEACSGLEFLVLDSGEHSV